VGGDYCVGERAWGLVCLFRGEREKKKALLFSMVMVVVVLCFLAMEQQRGLEGSEKMFFFFLLLSNAFLDHRKKRREGCSVSCVVWCEVGQTRKRGGASCEKREWQSENADVCILTVGLVYLLAVVRLFFFFVLCALCLCLFSWSAGSCPSLACVVLWSADGWGLRGLCD